ncbi:MAG TPA: biotin--[acetyl-CoA-carboxylase] ligase, partial [Planctomycetaceae bacterium]|nr:biotin--[acetyl-CoA-carboxylase] ligase [Planctomycetaceae bacterium]
MPPDRATDFDLERIIADTFVEQVQYHETIDSTSTAALESSQQVNLQTPLLVLAGQQTAGRGRGSNTWWSATGSLTFSLLIDPAILGIDQREWPQASLTTGLAICLALDELLDDQLLSLKWPNDVLLNDRKISGVLVEVAPRSPRGLVIGIGINVNNSCQSGPAELQSLATSMADASKQEFELDQVLIRVLQQLEKQLTRLINHDPNLIDDWQQH